MTEQRSVYINDYVLLTTAIFGAVVALTRLVAPNLISDHLKDVLGFAFFLTLTATLLSIYKIFKKQRYFAIMATAVLGSIGTLCWVYILVKAVSP
jgi:hypothetical protein